MRVVRNLWWFAVCLMLLAVGCGRKYYPVEGQIVYADGTPVKGLAGGTVTFSLPERMFSSVGEIDAEGRFRLTSESPNDGTPPGHYRVIVAPAPFRGEMYFGKGKAPPPPIDPRYAHPEKSGLEVDIEPRSGQKITLTVNRRYQK